MPCALRRKGGRASKKDGPLVMRIRRRLEDYFRFNSAIGI